METLLDPIVYPRIEVDGEPLEVRYRVTDVIALLRERRIDLFFPLANTERTRADEWEVIATMLAYGLRHTGRDDLTPEYFMQFDFARFGEFNEIVGAARKKATAWAATNGETPAPQTAPPTESNGG